MRTVRGTQPRSTLDPLTVLLAVAAWERFVADVGALSARRWDGPGLHARPEGGPQFGSALPVLVAAFGGRLPGDWRVRHFAAWTGTAPQQPVDLHGGVEPGQLADAVDAAIRLRGAAARRVLLQGPYRGFDAVAHPIPSGRARAVLALLRAVGRVRVAPVRVIDQTDAVLRELSRTS